MSVNIKSLFEAGVHFGHQTKYWNPKMAPYIYGARSKVHVINLDVTVPMFNDALSAVKQIIKNKGTLLFVGTKTQASEIIQEQAQRCNMPFVSHRWLGGMLTNFETVKSSIKKLEVLTAKLNDTESELSKKEKLDTERKVAKLEKTIGGISEMKKAPDAIFLVDTGLHDIAVKEAKTLGIPVFGIVDTNNDPSVIDYVIPGNDDSRKAIELYASVFADAVLEAKASAEQQLAQSVKVELVKEEATDEPKEVVVAK